MLRDAGRPLYEQFYRELHRRIVTGQLEPGTPLVEQSLAAAAKISRTPVRDAIRRLAQDGLVQVTANSGAIVAKLDANDLAEIYLCRLPLEKLATRLAAKESTPDHLAALQHSVVRMEQAHAAGELEPFIAENTQFHDLIVQSTRNRRLVAFLRHIRMPAYLFGVTMMKDTAQRNRIVREHRQVYEALKERDADLAEQLIEQHLNGDRQFLVRMLMVEDYSNSDILG